MSSPASPDPATASGELELPAAIRDRYAPLRVLGAGGSATVYLAFQRALKRQVVLKVSERTGTWSRVTFSREAKFLARLNHSNLLPVMDYGAEDGLSYIVYPYLPGTTARDLLRDETLPDTEAAARILHGVARALEYVHASGIVHRDVKPDNVLVLEDGSARLFDFGLALDNDTSRITAAGSLVGTIPYLSPEQCLGQDATVASDLYALGITAFELFSGSNPFLGATAADVIHRQLNLRPASLPPLPPELPAAVREAVLTLLEKEPSRRPGAGAFASLLEPLFPRDHAPEASSTVRAPETSSTARAPEASSTIRAPGASSTVRAPEASSTARAPTSPAPPFRVMPRPTSDRAGPGRLRWAASASMMLCVLALIFAAVRWSALERIDGRTGRSTQNADAEARELDRLMAPLSIFPLADSATPKGSPRATAAARDWVEAFDARVRAQDIQSTLARVVARCRGAPDTVLRPLYPRLCAYTRTASAARLLGSTHTADVSPLWPKAFRPLANLERPVGDALVVRFASRSGTVAGLPARRFAQVHVAKRDGALRFFVPSRTNLSLLTMLEPIEPCDSYVHPTPLFVRASRPGEALVLTLNTKDLSAAESVAVELRADPSVPATPIQLIGTANATARRTAISHSLTDEDVPRPAFLRMHYQVIDPTRAHGDAEILDVSLGFVSAPATPN